MGNIILTMLIIAFWGCAYILIRNNKVCKFRNYIANLIYFKGCDMINDGASLKDVSPLWDMLNDISYDEMLYSFKPLKMECWFTEEELKLLGYENEHLNKD